VGHIFSQSVISFVVIYYSYLFTRLWVVVKIYVWFQACGIFSTACCYQFSHRLSRVWITWLVASVTLSVCVCGGRVCLCVHDLKGNRLELSTPNLDTYTLWQFLAIHRSWGQRSRSRGYRYENRNGHMAPTEVCWSAIVLLLLARDCTSYDCLGF